MKSLALAALVLATAACADGAAPASTTEVRSVPVSPEAVFDQLVEALESGETMRAAELTDPAQVTLLAVAEGIGSREIVELTDRDRELIASNFWGGFAAQLRSSLRGGLAALGSGEIGHTEAGASRFAVVELESSADAAVRRVVIRDTPSGWVIDLLATFPSPLLERVPAAAEVVRLSGDHDLRQDLISYEDSIRYVLDDSGASPQLNQAAVAALEAIGR